jgi:PAS domain-containing protein
MASLSPSPTEAAIDLALAVVAPSTTPVLLLDGDLNIVAASRSFCEAFQVDPVTAPGRQVFALGDGEWDAPRYGRFWTPRSWDR